MHGHARESPKGEGGEGKRKRAASAGAHGNYKRREGKLEAMRRERRGKVRNRSDACKDPRTRLHGRHVMANRTRIRCESDRRANHPHGVAVHRASAAAGWGQERSVRGAPLSATAGSAHHYRLVQWRKAKQAFSA
jgi:hypothetical protein